MADSVNLIIDQGATFEVDFLIKDSANNTINLSTYTGVGKARKFISANTPVSFQVNTFSNGIMRGTLTSLQTNNMSYKDKYIYDFKLTSSSNVVSRACLLYTSPSPRDGLLSRMPSSA